MNVAVAFLVACASLGVCRVAYGRPAARRRARAQWRAEFVVTADGEDWWRP